MARRRGRRLAMTAAGLATVASPLLFGQQTAGAAQTEAEDEASLTFVDNSGQPVTCTVGMFARHNTDDADQPTLTWSTTRVGQPQGCYGTAVTALTANYKDSEGVIRRSTYTTFDDTLIGTVTGAYTATSVRMDTFFLNCDESRSATCEVTVTASPK
jgi:hypothetical protein